MNRESEITFPYPEDTKVPLEQIPDILVNRDIWEKMNIPEEDIVGVMETRYMNLYFEISSEIQEKIKNAKSNGDYEEAERLNRTAPMIISFRAARRTSMEFGLIDPETEDPLF